MIHENPLGYLLGIQGLALLRAFAGEHGREFTEARIAEIRRLLDDPRLAGAAVDVARVDPAEGYRLWSATYDGPNAAFDLDEPVLHDILGAIPAGDALDAACGTGRLTSLLARRGHRVVGVDGSTEMPAPEPDDGPPPAPAETLGPWDVWPWVLTDLAPEAARAASAGLSSMVIWHFQAD